MLGAGRQRKDRDKGEAVHVLRVAHNLVVKANVYIELQSNKSNNERLMESNKCRQDKAQLPPGNKTQTSLKTDIS